MYLQDYDEQMPNCCWFARVFGNTYLPGSCRQDGITGATPKDTYLPAPQYPPGYIQDFLYPYCKNAEIWFCPNVGKARDWVSPDPTGAILGTMGYSGTTYWWARTAAPGHLSSDPSWKGTILVSGRTLAAIPRPAEAVVIWDNPFFFPVRRCGNPKIVPAHAKGLNAVSADGHTQYSPAGSQPNGSPYDPGNCYYVWTIDQGW